MFPYPETADETVMATAGQDELLAWLEWNDPNGDYEELDIEELRQMALSQLDG